MDAEKKLAIIVSINDKYNYPIRTKYSTKVLNDAGYDVIVISSDFDHRKKKHYKDNREGLIQLPTRPYTKNLSISRIISLIDFSHKALKKAEELKPKLIYVSGPPNDQYKCFAKYKKHHPEAIIGAEVGDMWPESLPISGKLKKMALLPLKIWSSLRDDYLGQFDFIITECKLFETMLSETVIPDKLQTIYFCKDDNTTLIRDAKMDFNVVNLAYLGSVNNIIDIQLIAKMVGEIHQYKPVRFHLIGSGENKEELCELIKAKGAEICDYGEVYDLDRKSKILSQCMFAFNVMKTSVCVGMTMKSLDYFQFGIPILNNINGDIWKMTKDKNVGFNFNQNTSGDIAKRVANINYEIWNEMQINTRNVFDDNFSLKAFQSKFSNVIEK